MIVTNNPTHEPPTSKLTHDHLTRSSHNGLSSSFGDIPNETMLPSSALPCPTRYALGIIYHFPEGVSRALRVGGKAAKACSSIRRLKRRPISDPEEEVLRIDRHQQIYLPHLVS